ncbi:MAG: hypothetical protein FWG31_09820 [Oscillospiraceae bacterium]|nr:hypothetical protein [Oscillospiraceae bacterium]
MKEPKSISRSIRMTETVYTYVNQHIGDGFNQKFENICHRFMREEAELDRRISEKKKLLQQLNDKVRDIQNGLRTAEDIHWQLERIKTELRDSIDKCNSNRSPTAGAAG